MNRPHKGCSIVKILMVGDIIGEPGRNILARRLGRLIETYEIDLVVGNAENAAGGFGVTPKIADELYRMGIDILTTGNHVWDKKEIIEYIAQQPRLLRPANYPESAPGSGLIVMDLSRTEKVAVLQLMGRVFMPSLDCPFRAAKREVARLRAETPIILVDMHAEATSEKRAMGWYLDGEVSAVLGTHTHVQTADEEILPKGTAYLTDVGMTGPTQSVIGMNKEQVINKFLNQMPQRFEMGGGPCVISAALVTVDSSGRAQSIVRLQVKDTEP
ncbi:MAG: TIGR00282 family metallophosphoesterase [Nitrospirae bacterium]|nr:TIGR00282 family metallophosphoesterase [Nitrospirota bacterium]